DDNGLHYQVADLIHGTTDIPFYIRNSSHPTIKDLFSSTDIPAALRWLEERTSSAHSVNTRDWTWATPDTGGSLFCVGRNYAAHASELGNKVPGKPLFFMKPRGCLAANEQKVAIPSESDRVDYEGELALVVGRDLRGPISLVQARSAIVAVTLLNDITDRAQQQQAKEKGKPWFRAKGRIGFAPVGPYLRFIDSGIPLSEFRYTTSLNGEIVQNGEPSLWLWNAETIVQDLSESVGLECGDMISMGTPAGVGPLKPGDVVELNSTVIGTLRTEMF
ncbi:MAG TPA: FAA hydrolase family protein, partial [Bacteroidetes bacterium]|nr:FAA hydrolase family protein [Bacteroidota bacterium]HEX03815.1 FAA hydrolase family protein [Bacteroidota bacterium]